MTTDAVAQPPPALLPGGAADFAGDRSGSAAGEAAVGHPADRAVEATLQVGDLQAAASLGTQSAVNLRFNVAGENLSVRVALQAGQVHTQFSTPSGELRTALAHEWQAIGASPTGQARFAEPVFTSGSRADGKAASDLGSEARQQGGQHRQGMEGEAPVQILSPLAAAGTPAREPEAELAAPMPLSRLQSFA